MQLSHERGDACRTLGYASFRIDYVRWSATRATPQGFCKIIASEVHTFMPFPYFAAATAAFIVILAGCSADDDSSDKSPGATGGAGASSGGNGGTVNAGTGGSGG